MRDHNRRPPEGAHQHSHERDAHGSPAVTSDGRLHHHGHVDTSAPAANQAHSHGAAHEHEHDDHHEHGPSWLGPALDYLPFVHRHSHTEATVDTALEGSERGLWALKVSVVGLGLTALFQLAITLASGSVGLLADTIHNFGDAFTAIPLAIAFIFGQRPPTRRYTYGYGRAEDLAGIAIVGIIFVSAGIAAYESYDKLIHPRPPDHLGWVMAAAIVGFLGNEAVAVFRIRIGRAIGSAALIADGQHARADGFTSLAVFVGAVAVAAGFPLADPIVGLLITIAILAIVKDTAKTMWRRLMDAVEPEWIDTMAAVATSTPGVLEVHDVRARWLGHRLEGELHILVDADLPTRDSHDLAEEVRHRLFAAEPRLSVVTVHVDPENVVHDPIPRPSGGHSHAHDGSKEPR